MLVEQVGQERRLDADTVVFHHETPEPSVSGTCADRHAPVDPRELQGVCQQVDQHFGDPNLIDKQSKIPGHVILKGNVLLNEGEGEPLEAPVKENLRFDALGLYRDLAVLQ